jgi:hypothetical protein
MFYLIMMMFIGLLVCYNGFHGYTIHTKLTSLNIGAMIISIGFAAFVLLKMIPSAGNLYMICTNI